jgi:tellurite resistance protein
MPAQYIRSSTPAESPFDRDEQALKALVTAGAFVALADGRAAAIERDEAVLYIVRRRVAPTISQQHIAALFDQCTRDLQDRNFVDLIGESLRPVVGLSLTSDVIRIAELVAAADGHVHPSEMRVIRLLRLLTMTF